MKAAFLAVEAHQSFEVLERMPDWKLEFYFQHVAQHLERKAEAMKEAQKG